MKPTFSSQVAKLILILVCACFIGACGVRPTLTERGMEWSYGDPVLRPENIENIGKHIQENRPQTFHELSALMGGPPMGTYTKKGVTHSIWEWQQYNTGFKTYLGFCACISRGDMIERVGIRWFERPPSTGLAKVYGDEDVTIGGNYPGILMASKQSFRKKETSRAEWLGLSLNFSPSGMSSCLLTPQKKVKKWMGESVLVHDSNSDQDSTYSKQIQIERMAQLEKNHSANMRSSTLMLILDMAQTLSHH